MADYEAERDRRLAFYSALMREAGMPLEEVRLVDRARKQMGVFAAPVRPTGTTKDGETLRLGDEDWLVLHTPGHAEGLVCLYQPQRRLLLSSDHLLRDISSNPIVEPPEQEGTERPRQLVDYIRQLQRVAALPVTWALPGHGRPVDDVPGLVARHLEFHRQRGQEVLRTLENGPRTPYEISQLLFPRLDPVNASWRFPRSSGIWTCWRRRER